MPTLDQIAVGLTAAHVAGDRTSAGSLAKMFSDTAAAMDPTEISVLRSKNTTTGAMLRSLAAQPVAGETPDQRVQRLYGNTPNKPIPFWEGVTRASNQGATAALGDESVAAARAAFDPDQNHTFREKYQNAVAVERGRKDQFASERPGVSFAAEAASALPAMVVGAGALASGARAVGATEAAIAAARQFPRIASVVSSPTVGGIATGGTQGAIYGANAGTGGVGSRAHSAILPGVFGGFLGALAPLAGAAVGNFKASTEADRLARQIGQSRVASDFLRRTMGADDAFTQGEGRMNAAGAGAMLVDAGRSARNAVDAIIQSNGPGAKIARDAIEARARQGGVDITNALDSGLGKVGESTSRALTVPGQTERQILSDLYGKAYSAPIDYTTAQGKAVEELIQNRVPKDAIDAANRLMRVEGAQSAQIMATVGEDGAVAYKTMPDVHQIDYITRGLNEVAEAQNGLGKLGGTTALGRAYTNLSSSLRDAVRTSVPEYDTALKAAKNLIREKNAGDFGKSILDPSVTRSDVATEVKTWGDASRRAAVDSVRQSLDDTLANVTRTLQNPNMDSREAIATLRMMSSRAVRDKVGSLIGDDAAAKMFAEIDRAANSLDLKGSIADTTRSFARTNLSDAMKAMTDGGVINSVKGGEVFNLGKSGVVARLIQHLTGYNDAARLAMTDSMQEELATALTGPNGLATLRALRMGATRPEAVGAAARTSATARAKALAGALSGAAATPVENFWQPTKQSPQ